MVDAQTLVVPDAEALAAVAAARWVQACHHAVARRGRFAVALAGGGTPLPVYRRLAERRDLPWERVLVLWGDERSVEPTSAQRNERQAREVLLDHVGLPDDSILGWGWGATPERLAAEFEERLLRALGDPPELDLVLLGLGGDGHTASLWPGDAALEAPGWTAVTQAPDGSRRLTLTPLALSSAEEVLVLVQGREKRSALADVRSVLAEPRPGDRPSSPFAWIRPRVRLTLLADAAASGPADGVAVEG